MDIANSFAKFVAKRRWIRRLGLFKLPSKLSTTYNGIEFYADPNDWKGPSYHILNWGLDSYEPENVSFIQNYLSHSPQGVFLDIGSNIGIITFLTALKYSELRILAFEPEPTAYNCITETLKNEKLKNVSVHHVGLSDKKDKLSLFRDASNSGGHSVVETAIIEDGNKIEDHIEIKVYPLDNFLEQQGIKQVDLIKLDVQRHEAQVLRGAKNLLNSSRPSILMECYFDDLLKENSDLLTPFEGLNYQIFEPRSSQIFSLDHKALQAIKDNSNSLYCDLVFFPKEKKDLLLTKKQ